VTPADQAGPDHHTGSEGPAHRRPPGDNRKKQLNDLKSRQLFDDKKHADVEYGDRLDGAESASSPFGGELKRRTTRSISLDAPPKLGAPGSGEVGGMYVRVCMCVCVCVCVNIHT
jgi:hypothetical protein